MYLDKCIDGLIYFSKMHYLLGGLEQVYAEFRRTRVNP